MPQVFYDVTPPPPTYRIPHKYTFNCTIIIFHVLFPLVDLLDSFCRIPQFSQFTLNKMFDVQCRLINNTIQ